MAFFEKLSAVAKNVTDKAAVVARDAADKASELAKVASEKANTAIEVGKLNAQIREEKNQIAVVKNQMGQWIWERFSAGETVDPALEELCGKITAANGAIEALNLQAAALKVQNETADAPFEAVPEEDLAPQEAPEEAQAAEDTPAAQLPQEEEPHTPDQE